MEIIRVRTTKELNDCLYVRRKVFIEEQQVSEDLEIDELDASPSAGRHVLIREHGKPAATGRLKPYDESTAKLQRIAVLASMRGTGLGRAIVEQLEREAIEAGYAAAVLDAQVQAEPFYANLGYETVSPETFLDAGIPHVRMMKRLV